MGYTLHMNSGRAGGAGLAGWRTGWWSVVLACSLGGSVGSGRLRGSDGPGRACLARLGSACDCVCLKCICVGRSPLKDRFRCVCFGLGWLSEGCVSAVCVSAVSCAWCACRCVSVLACVLSRC